MRGNLLVNLAAILVMLASVLVGGGYWLVNKKEESMRVFERSEKKSNMSNSFESLQKRTE